MTSNFCDDKPKIQAVNKLLNYLQLKYSFQTFLLNYIIVENVSLTTEGKMSFWNEYLKIFMYCMGLKILPAL